MLMRRYFCVIFLSAICFEMLQEYDIISCLECMNSSNKIVCSRGKIYEFNCGGIEELWHWQG